MKKGTKIAAVLLAGVAGFFVVKNWDSVKVFFGTVTEKVKELFGDEKQKLTVIKSSAFHESENKYQVVDSYATEDGDYYYFYYLGLIDYVPLNLSSSDGVYFNGNNLTLEFKLTQTEKEVAKEALENAIENSVDLTTKTYDNASVGAQVGVFNAKVEAGISNSATTSIANTYTESFSAAVEKETTFERKITYKMSKDDPAGFYFYTAVASMRVFEVVVYNPNTKKVKYMDTYSEIGAAVPGLFYSSTSFFDDFGIEFDENMLPEFDKPFKTVSNDITVDINSDGAVCDVIKKDLTIGGTYGALPQVSKQGYNFKGWYVNGRKIEENSMVASLSPIIAKWELVTEFVFYDKREVSFKKSENLNPWSWIIDIPGAGETSLTDVDLWQFFDLIKLREDGYKMQIILKYEVKRSTGAAFGLKYKLDFRSGEKTIWSVSNTIDNTSYKQKMDYSDYISLKDVSGSFNYRASTENIFNCYIKNFYITVRFTK